MTSETENQSRGDALAAGWERSAGTIAQTSVPTTRWLLDHLDPRPGDTVLELGAGPGDTGFEAAERVAPNGRLMSTDLSAAMVEVAIRRAAARDISNIEFRIIDAQAIDLEDASVDCVIHRWGPMLLPEPKTGFTEVYRVLRERGRYAAATFSGPEHNPWLTTFVMSVMQSGVQMPTDANPFGPGGPFSLSDPEVFRSLVTAAGFEGVTVEAVDQTWDWPTVDDAWGQMSATAGAVAVALANLDAGRRDEIRSNYATALEPYKKESGYSVPGKPLCVFGRKS